MAIIQSAINKTKRPQSLQRVFDHFWLGDLLETKDCYYVGISEVQVPVFVCKTIKGTFAVLEFEARHKDIHQLIESAECELELVDSAFADTNRTELAQIDNYYYIAYQLYPQKARFYKSMLNSDDLQRILDHFGVGKIQKFGIVENCFVVTTNRGNFIVYMHREESLSKVRDNDKSEELVKKKWDDARRLRFQFWDKSVSNLRSYVHLKDKYFSVFRLKRLKDHKPSFGKLILRFLRRACGIWASNTTALCL